MKKGVIEYRFKSVEGKKEIYRTIRYNNLMQYIFAIIKANIAAPDAIINHKETTK